MSPASFLLLALGISVVGSLVLWARTHRPGGIDASINDFRRELAALSPDRSPDAVVREQSRLRAEGRWIDRPQPSAAAAGGAAGIVVYGDAEADDDVAPAPTWTEADGGDAHLEIDDHAWDDEHEHSLHDDDEHDPEFEDVDEGAYEAHAADHLGEHDEHDHLIDPDDGDDAGGGYFDDMYADEADLDDGHGMG